MNNSRISWRSFQNERAVIKKIREYYASNQEYQSIRCEDRRRCKGEGGSRFGDQRNGNDGAL